MKRNYWILVACLGVLVAGNGRRGQAAAALDDATILAVFDQANQTDIVTGRLGAKYGASEDVRMLGRMVARDHIAVQQMGRDLAKKLDVMPTPPDNDTSIADCAKIVALLQSKRGIEFDRAYLQHEVSYHQSVVDAMKGTLLPAAKHEDVRSLLKAVLPGFESHLAATKAAAAKMGIK